MQTPQFLSSQFVRIVIIFIVLFIVFMLGHLDGTLTVRRVSTKTHSEPRIDEEDLLMIHKQVLDDSKVEVEEIVDLSDLLKIFELPHEESGKAAIVYQGEVLSGSGDTAVRPYVLTVKDQDGVEEVLMQLNTEETKFGKAISDLLFSPLGNYLVVLVSGYESGDQHIYDTNTGDALNLSAPNENEVWDHDIAFWSFDSVVWSDDEQVLAIVSAYNGFDGTGSNAVYLALDGTTEFTQIYSIDPLPNYLGNLVLDDDIVRFDVLEGGLSGESPSILESYTYDLATEALTVL